MAANNRLLKEWRELQKHRDSSQGITLTPIKENDLFQWNAEIVGPDDTPFAGGRFKLRVSVPSSYPHAPPRISFITKICHPNIHFKTGEICLDILKCVAPYTKVAVIRGGSIVSLCASSLKGGDRLLGSRGQPVTVGHVKSIHIQDNQAAMEMVEIVARGVSEPIHVTRNHLLTLRLLAANPLIEALIKRERLSKYGQTKKYSYQQSSPVSSHSPTSPLSPLSPSPSSPSAPSAPRGPHAHGHANEADADKRPTVGLPRMGELFELSAGGLYELGEDVLAHVEMVRIDLSSLKHINNNNNNINNSEEPTHTMIATNVTPRLLSCPILHVRPLYPKSPNTRLPYISFPIVAHSGGHGDGDCDDGRRFCLASGVVTHNSEWTPIWTLENCLRAVQALLGNPDASSPLNCDAGNLIRGGDLLGYYSLARHYTVKYAEMAKSKDKVEEDTRKILADGMKMSNQQNSGNAQTKATTTTATAGATA